MIQPLSTFLPRQQGATAVEYALIVGILATLIAAAFLALGGSFTSVFDAVIAAMGGAPADP